SQERLVCSTAVTHTATANSTNEPNTNAALNRNVSSSPSAAVPQLSHLLPPMNPIPRSLAEILLRCLHENADQRPNSMLIVADELRERYSFIFQHAYRHTRIPDAPSRESLPDALNNMAVSLYEVSCVLSSNDGSHTDDTLPNTKQHLQQSALDTWRRA